MNRKLDPSLLRFGDVLCVTSGAPISEAIRIGECVSDGDLGEIPDAIGTKEIPSHTLFVTDPDKLVGHEMTAPEDRKCSLKPYIDGSATVISCLRNPWYTVEHNQEGYKVTRERLQQFFDDFHSQYSYYNLFNFLTHFPQDKRHLVCSQYTLLGWIVSTTCQGYECNFPADWVIAGIDNMPWPGMVSPRMLDHGGNALGWAVNVFEREGQ
jgi:hypothetical protein